MFKLFHVGATALIAALIDALKIPELIDKIVPWDEKQCKLSPGQRIKVLLVNILTDRKPLYAIQEFFKDKDIKNLFGPDVEIKDLNDDCLGKVLDKIYDAGPKKVFSTIAFNVIDLEDIELDTLHADTTSWSLYGEYDNRDSEDESGPINITHGYSKDHRPDLKQFIYGLVVNKDKFPVIGESHSGNTDDKTWNNQLISKIDEYLGEELLKEVLYVADSALVTKDNLAKIAERGNFKFVSRLPGTFALEKELKAKAWEEDNWEYAGKFSEYNNAASYRYQSFIDQIDGHKYRFVVVHSSKLDGRKTRGFNKRLEKERESLKKAADKIAKREFTTKDTALEAWNNFQQNHQSEFYPISLELKEGQQRKMRKKRGRPPKDYVPEYEKIYQLQVHIGPCDEKAVQQAKERLSCFVLITNVLEDDKYSDLDILSKYKK